MRLRLAALLLIAGLVPLLSVAAPPPNGVRGTPEALAALETQVKSALDRAEGGVVALVVSRSPRHPAPEAGSPLKLGDYPAAPEPGWPGRRGPALPAGFDPRLDLADPRNAADYPTGSGVVLSADGLVLTNYHLIEGARKVYVRASNGQGSYADLHAADARSDLAVVRLQQPVPGLTPVAIFDGRTTPGARGEPANLVRGMLLLTLGHPGAANAADGAPTTSWGTLSGTRRRGPAGPSATDETPLKPLHQFGVLLQTDARLTLGCSGAALFNLDGQLVGLGAPTVAVAGADTAGGYALPMDPNYRRIVAALRAGREVEYGLLGVTFNAARGRGFAPGGALIEGGGLAVGDVMPGGPASDAGLVGDARGMGQGDVIVAVEGAPVRDFDELFAAVGAALAGTTVQLDVVRGGTARRVPVTLGKYVHRLPWVAANRPRPLRGLTADYATVAQQKLRLVAVPAGVFAAELEPGSPAALALAAKAESLFPAEPDKVRGWAVTRVNGKPVNNPRDFSAAAEAAGAGEVELTVLALPGNGGEFAVRVPAE